MKHEQIAQLVRRIARTLDEELACEEAGILTPQCIDSLLAGKDTLDNWALLLQHLEQCSVCAEEFRHLRACAQMEQDETWPTPARLLEETLRRQLSA